MGPGTPYDLPMSMSRPDGASRQQDRIAARQEAMRRKRRQRLLPLLGVAGIGVLLIAWFSVGSSSSTSTTSSTTPKRSTTTTTAPAYLPAPIAPSVQPPQAGEGQWTAMDTWSPGPPSIMTTTYRPDPSNVGIVAYASWIRTTTTQLALFLGYQGPGATSIDRGPQQVPMKGRENLLATFNSGFYEADSAEGFYTNGTSYFPMVKGHATLVRYVDGTVDVVDWQGASTPGPNVAMARQNLQLLVNDGAVTPEAANNGAYGITLGGVPAVWRTGIGIDPHGDLIYATAASQTSASLAQIFLHLGCVRAMQLDINPAWPIFVTNGGPNAADPALFVPNPQQVPWRFLSSSTKDFFAVYLKQAGAIAQPW